MKIFKKNYSLFEFYLFTKIIRKKKRKKKSLIYYFHIKTFNPITYTAIILIIVIIYISFSFLFSSYRLKIFKNLCYILKTLYYFKIFHAKFI